MKKTFLLFTILMLFSSCATIQTGSNSKPDTTPQEDTVTPDTITEAEPIDPVHPVDDIIKQYRKEGFVNPHTYSIIIVRPSDSTDSKDDILKQAKKRTLVSFTKYLRSQGKIVSGNMNASLLNIIEENGTLKVIDDSAQSRVVYIFIVERDQLKRYIDGL